MCRNLAGLLACLFVIFFAIVVIVAILSIGIDLPAINLRRSPSLSDSTVKMSDGRHQYYRSRLKSLAAAEIHRAQSESHDDEAPPPPPPDPPASNLYTQTYTYQDPDEVAEELEITSSPTLKRLNSEEAIIETARSGRKQWCREKRYFVLGAVLLVLVAIAVALGVVLGGANGSSSQSSAGSAQLQSVNVPDDFPSPPDDFAGPTIVTATDASQTTDNEAHASDGNGGVISETSGGGDNNDSSSTTGISIVSSPSSAAPASAFTSPSTLPPTDAPSPAPTTPVCPSSLSASYSSHDENDELTYRKTGQPDRKFRIYTPDNFDPSQPSKVVFIYHGWTRGTYCRGRVFLNSEWRDVADEHGYVLVGVDGLAENDSDAPRSHTFPGSADGLGRDGVSVTTCKTGYGPDYCYPSCQRQGRCNNRCGWTHCLMDDVQFFVDLVDEVTNKYVCLDRSRVYVYGYSMGGMFTWSLAQDPRSSPLIAGIGAAQGLPMHDYLLGKGDSLKNIPAIGIYGNNDCSVPPGDGTNVYNEVCDDDGYLYVDAFHQHRLWAEEHGCAVGDTHPARYEYSVDGRDEVECATHCDPAHGPPMSVDCRNDAEHGKEPWHLDIVLKFFEDHWQANN